MQRMILSLDLKDNEVLTKEIERIIEETVKSKARSFFTDHLEELVEKKANSILESWTKSSYGKKSHLDSLVRDQIDTQVRKEIQGLNVTPSDVANRIDLRFTKVDALIIDCIQRKMNTINITEEHIESRLTSIINKKLDQMLPQQILSLIIQGISKNESSS